MSWLKEFFLRLHATFRGDQIDREIDEEMRFHLEMRSRENVESGMTPAEARRDALRRFGNITYIKEMSRDVRGGGMIETLLQDLRYGTRMLLKKPGFTIVAVLTLALGIGANTAVFSVVNGVLFRPLPYKDTERIITIWEPSRGGRTLGLTDLEFFDLRQQNYVFEDIAAYATGATNLSGRGEPERVAATWVSSGFFPVLGVQPSIGRSFTPEDDKPGLSQVVVLSYGLWQRRFASDPSVIDQQISLNGISRTIIGVMPSDFQFDSKDVELWIPLGLDPANVNPGDRSYRAVARLKPDVTLEQARREMNSLAARLADEHKKRYPAGVNATQSLNLIPIYELIVGDIRPVLLILLAAIGFVFLIACANVANLMLAHAEARQKEIAIRIALGAGRARIIRQLLTESLILSVMGGSLGMLLAVWGVQALIAIASESVPRTDEVSVNVAVLVFTFAVSVLAGIIFGLVPALASSKVNLHLSLKESGKAATGGSGSRTRYLLVASEIALALVLLISAGLMINSILHLINVDPGFDSKNVLTARIMLPQSKYPEHQQVDAFYKQLLERIEALPGVTSVGTVTVLPLSGLNSNASFEIEGRPRASDQVVQNADYRMVSRGYFRTMGISLLEGRDFEESDQESAPGVVIINDTMARIYWPDEDVIGKRINLGVPGSPWLIIVGVVKDVKHQGLDVRPNPQMYFLHSQNAYSTALGVWRSTALVIRTASDPQALIGGIKSEVQSIDKDLPLAKIQTMEQVMSSSIARSRFTMVLLATFALVALVLAAVGVYGIISYVVTQRTHEIGIRMALGAQPRQVLKLVVGQVVVLAIAGVIMGLGLAVASTRVMANLLFGVSTTDPITFIVISLLLIGVSVAASLVPARRAINIDPMEALRYE